MFNNITGELRAKINNALALNKNGDNKKVDSKSEYDALSKLLSGCEKNSEAYNHIDGLMIEYTSKGNAVGNRNNSAVDNNVTQEGVGNVNGNNNDVTITINQLTIDQSRERGSRLADILVGLSDGDEYAEVRRTVNKDANAENVMEILRGYEDRRPSASSFTNGDHFFEQLFTESGFDRKDVTIKTMARHLRGYYAAKGGAGANQVKTIDAILNKSKLTKEDAVKLDKIYMAELGD